MKLIKTIPGLFPSLILASLFMSMESAQAQLSGYEYEPVVDGYLGEYALTTPPLLQPGGIGGAAVQDIQILLDELGYYNGMIDGFYGDAVVNAIQNFQSDYALEATGTLTPETWDILLGLELDEIYEDGDYFVEASGLYYDVE